MTEEEERAYCEQAVQCFHGDMATLLMQKRAEAFEAGRSSTLERKGAVFAATCLELTACKAKLARVEAAVALIGEARCISGTDQHREAADLFRGMTVRTLRAALEDK